MIDPAKLIAGSKVVYGEERFRTAVWRALPIPAERVVDRRRMASAASSPAATFELIHTPGHALHHYAIVDAAHASIFPGDTFGISYRRVRYGAGRLHRADDDSRRSSIRSSSSPRSIGWSAYRARVDVPDALQPRHGRAAARAATLKAQIRELVRIARAQRRSAGPLRARSERTCCELWLRPCAQARRARCPMREIDRLLEDDLDLNTQGLVVWLDGGKRS